MASFSDLVGLLSGGDSDTIKRLDAEIVQTEANLAALRALRQLAPEQQPRQTQERSTLTGQRRKSVHDYLSSHNVATLTTLARALGIPTGSMAHVLNHFWFRKTPEGYRLNQKAPIGATNNGK